jgi:hypothetical protein
VTVIAEGLDVSAAAQVVCARFDSLERIIAVTYCTMDHLIAIGIQEVFEMRMSSAFGVLTTKLTRPCLIDKANKYDQTQQKQQQQQQQQSQSQRGGLF